jgi:hypothetical protein
MTRTSSDVLVSSWGRRVKTLKRLAASTHRVLADRRRKPLAVVVCEATQFAVRHMEVPYFYFGSLGYCAGSGDHRDYIGHRDLVALHAWLRRSESAAVLNDKLSFHCWFRDAGLPLTRVLAHNDRAMLHFADDDAADAAADIGDTRGFVQVLERLRALSRTGAVFAKPVDGMEGEGAGRIDASSDLELLRRRITSGRFLFEEALTLAAVYPHAVNTLRVLTCARGDGRTPVVCAALLRVGVGGSDVDNASRGGIFVGVDQATGRLFAEGRRFLRFGGDAFAVHPDTGFRFEGFELPYFGAALATARAAGAHLPHALIGWDIAIAEDGPVLIEGNSRPHLGLVQAAIGRGMLADPAFRELYTSLHVDRHVRWKGY